MIQYPRVSIQRIIANGDVCAEKWVGGRSDDVSEVLIEDST